uniref:Uncharacterized protein n=1 Tax=Thermogemmatispora argillosa TaxID=2045280 RepID=A0A455SWY7_9CHLR|nr:hypothetical protein KTA_02850 [Thermogemmatispora argillosa]
MRGLALRPKTVALDVSASVLGTASQILSPLPRFGEPGYKAGLNTNPSGQHVTEEDLYRATMATRSIVSGYWFNIPAGGR